MGRPAGALASSGARQTEDTDGLSVLEKIRNRKTSPPVLILSARDAVDDRVKGGDSGNRPIRKIERQHVSFHEGNVGVEPTRLL